MVQLEEKQLELYLLLSSETDIALAIDFVDRWKANKYRYTAK